MDRFRLHELVMSGCLAALALGCAASTPEPVAAASSSHEHEAATSPRKVVVYSSEQTHLHAYALSPKDGELAPVSTVTLPEQVQYAAQDPGSHHLYVAASNGSTNHWLYAFAIDPSNGALVEHGQPLVPPGGRIVHLSVDAQGRYLLLAHNQTSRVSSVRLNEDGTLGAFVEQPGPVDTGFYAHQALIDDQGTGVVACGLGAAAKDGADERPGSLTVFGYDAGILTRTQSMLLGPGLGARHLEYHAGHVYVAMERGNRLVTYDYAGGVLGAAPRFDVSTLLQPEEVKQRQRAGTIHIHPNGKYLYLSNRASATESKDVAGQPTDVFVGGENDIAFYELDAGSGEPRFVERYDTHGFEPRTFSIDPSGHFLIVGNQLARNVLDAAGALQTVSRNVAVFRIAEDGKLSYLRQYDFSGGDGLWVKALALPQ